MIKMKMFASPIKFAEHLLTAATAEVVALHTGLVKTAELVQKTAQSEIGHLQPSVGPFPAWEELAESTKEDKERKGYVFNGEYNPLLRTGSLRDSIEYEISGAEAVIGSRSPIAAYQEFGTSRGIPPRPFMGPALFRNKDKIIAIFGTATIIGIAGGREIEASIGRELGYHLDISP